jgi:CBS domain-containing protein
VTPEQSFPELIDRFAAERTDSLPVTDGDGQLIGVVAAADVERAVGQGSVRTAATLTREAPTLRPDDPLEDAVHVLGATDDEGVA